MSKQEGTTPSTRLSFVDLGEGWVPLEFLLMVKCLDPKGRVRYREMSSTTLHPVEALGMLSTMGDTVRKKLMHEARNMTEWDEE
jgi:hypothetical protein